jgi:hypothetical protein
MKFLPVVLAFFLPLLGLAAENPVPQFDAHAAERFARLALACVQKQYPNKISHVLNSDADVAAPRKLTPAFYGCYDWHSSVHGFRTGYRRHNSGCWARSSDPFL